MRYFKCFFLINIEKLYSFRWELTRDETEIIDIYRTASYSEETTLPK